VRPRRRRGRYARRPRRVDAEARPADQGHELAAARARWPDGPSGLAVDDAAGRVAGADSAGRGRVVSGCDGGVRDTPGRRVPRTRGQWSALDARVFSAEAWTYRPIGDEGRVTPGGRQP